MEITAHELEILVNERNAHQAVTAEINQFTFSGSKADKEAACTIVLRDKFASILIIIKNYIVINFDAYYTRMKRRQSWWNK